MSLMPTVICIIVTEGHWAIPIETDHEFQIVDIIYTSHGIQLVTLHQEGFKKEEPDYNF